MKLQTVRSLFCILVVLLIATSSFAVDSFYDPVGQCAWPSSVMLTMEINGDEILCSAAYVGDRVVVTAGHCIKGGQNFKILFGEDLENPWHTAEDVSCVAKTGGEWDNGVVGGTWDGVDMGYCILPETAPEIPFIPVMVLNGCEVEHLNDELFGPATSDYGVEALTVASGRSGDGDDSYGLKRAGDLNVLWEKYSSRRGELALEALQRDLGTDWTTHPGDSGGPVIYEMPDGSSRIIGINSYRTNLKQADLDGDGSLESYHWAIATSLPRHVLWVEETSGRDITPCHTPFNNQWYWNDDPSCGQFLYDITPESGSGGNDCGNTSTLNVATACAGWLAPLGGNGSFTGHSDGEALVDFLLNGPNNPTIEDVVGGLLPYPQKVGTHGADGLTGDATNAEELIGGGGNDFLVAGFGGALHGGSGDDYLLGSTGSEIMVPGRGRDTVDAGAGDDILVIRGTCDLDSGEILDGGPGVDQLLSPLSERDLYLAGVQLNNIEELILHHPDALGEACDPVDVELLKIGTVDTTGGRSSTF